MQVATWAWATQLTPVAAAVAAACAASCAAIVVASFNSRRRFHLEQPVSGAFFGAVPGTEESGISVVQPNGYSRLYEEEGRGGEQEQEQVNAAEEAAKEESWAPSLAQASVQGSTSLLSPAVQRSLSLKALADASAVAGAGAPIGMSDEECRQLRALQEAHRAQGESSRGT